MSSERLELQRPCRLRGVAFVVPGFDAPAGPGRVARRLAEAMAAQGVPITYVTTGAAGSAGAAGAPLAGREVRGIVQVFRVPAAVHELTALALLAARRERVDGVYGLWSQGGPAALRVARALDAPAVLRLTRCPRPADAAALRRAARVLAPTSGLAAEAEALGLAHDRVTLLPDGVDLEEFAPRPAPAGRHVVLLDPPGDPARAAAVQAALARVVAARQDLRPDLRVERQVGSPPPERQRVALAWVLPEPDDAAPAALLEALAAGIPIVAARSPGLAEAVRDGQEALLTSAAPEALAAGLADLLDDPARAARHAAAGRARAEEGFELAQVAARHALLFEALKAGRSTPPAPALARGALGALVRAGRHTATSTLGRTARSLRPRGASS